MSEEKTDIKLDSTSSDALAEDVDKLEIKQQDSAAGEAETSVPEATAAPEADTRDGEQETSMSAQAAPEKQLEEDVGETQAQAREGDEDVEAHTENVSSDQVAALTNSAATEALPMIGLCPLWQSMPHWHQTPHGLPLRSAPRTHALQ